MTKLQVRMFNTTQINVHTNIKLTNLVAITVNLEKTEYTKYKNRPDDNVLMLINIKQILTYVSFSSPPSSKQSITEYEYD
ncbi:11100_t:CDS:2 [Diversispora eburnea]|uniref:11100_t:CDS:1 n=1 Tax=Diversispora eburnea TaxID=1213867 RepID=A0A9N8Z024_9GLOM|nr:11100_t:CDS:2 [Diversispora eburnea]